MPRTRLLSHTAGSVTWQLAIRAPAPALAGMVTGDYLGYDESSPTPIHRREFASPGAVIIIELGTPLRLRSDTTPGSTTHRHGFLATPGEHATLTDHDGHLQGIEVNLTPIGAHLLLLNAPMAALAGHTIGLDDILRDLPERLQNTRDWDARFDLLDRALLARLARARPATPTLRHALDRITATAGQIDIASLAAELGHSQKSLIHHFNTQIGLSPKRFARLIRFDRVVQHLRSGGTDSWTDLAARFGYYDQSHLIRDFHQFTGLAPTAARATLTPFLT